MLSSTLESRERWRTLLYQAVDLVFETDRRGRIILISPETWLGQSTTPLIGRPFSSLCGATDPFQPHTGTPVQITTPQGELLTVILSCHAYRDAEDQITGARGTLKALPLAFTQTFFSEAADGTQPSVFPDGDHLSIIASVTAALRKAIVPRLATAAALDALLPFLSAQGALIDTAISDKIVFTSAPLPDDLTSVVQSSDAGVKTQLFRSGMNHVMICRENIRSKKQLCLGVWRPAAWTADDRRLCKTVCALLAGFWELDSIHRRILSDSGFDVSSNLLNWNGLKAEIERRTRRLDQEALAATLIIAQIPDLQEISKKRGFEAGEEALRQCTALLRRAVRPTDAIARISSNTFALWLDGGDRFAAAERAERMTSHGIPVLIDPPVHLPLRLGLVSREANADETPDSLLERGLQALHEGLSENRNWRFSHEAP